jgi:hypothetical protein
VFSELKCKIYLLNIPVILPTSPGLAISKKKKKVADAKSNVRKFGRC